MQTAVKSVAIEATSWIMRSRLRLTQLAGEISSRCQRSTIAARARGCKPFEDDRGAGVVACGQRRAHGLAEIVSAPREAAEQHERCLIGNRREGGYDLGRWRSRELPQ